MADPENDGRGTEIEAALMEAVLEDMAAHFLPPQRRWGWERRAWSMVQEGKVVRSQTDYILGTDQSLFWNVSVRDLRHNTDHHMVLGCLHSANEREHAKYLTGRKKLPLRPPADPTREEGIFAFLRRAVPKPHARKRRINEWISEDTWRLFDNRVSARRGERGKARIWRLSRAIAASLKGDMKRRIETAGKEVETLLEADPPNPREVWRRLKGWYKATVNRAPPPVRATLERITAERVNLYSYMPSPGENIAVTVRPVKVYDSVPTEDEIEEAVNNMQRKRSGGGAGMRAEHLKGWPVASKREKRAADKGEEKTEGEEGGHTERTS